MPADAATGDIMRYGSAPKPRDPRAMELLASSLARLEELAAAGAKNMGPRRQMIDLCLRTGERYAARSQVSRAVGLFRKGIAIFAEMSARDATNIGTRSWRRARLSATQLSV